MTIVMVKYEIITFVMYECKLHLQHSETLDIIVFLQNGNFLKFFYDEVGLVYNIIKPWNP